MALYALLDTTVTPAKVVDTCSPPDGETIAQCTFLSAAQIASAQEVPAGVPVGIGWTFANGAFSSGVAAPVPTLAQQAATALTAGLTITATGPTLTMAATLFPTDPATQTKLNTIVNSLNTSGGTFFGGATTGLMKDASGSATQWHTFTADQYKAVASAIGEYVATLDLIIDGNPLNATELPASSVTISV